MGPLSALCLPKFVYFFSALVLFGLLWFNRKNEPEEEWEAFTESLFLVVKVIILYMSIFRIATASGKSIAAKVAAANSLRQNY